MDKRMFKKTILLFFFLIVLILLILLCLDLTHITLTSIPKLLIIPPQIHYVSLRSYLMEYPYDYHFIINEPKKCEQQKTFLVLMVPVAPHNRAHRDVVRSTWGGESLVGDKVVTLFFLLGLHTEEGAEQLQEKLLLESKEHRDLIQFNFIYIAPYHNKVISGHSIAWSRWRPTSTHTKTQQSHHEQALGENGKENSLLTGRNLKQNQALGGRSSASTGWVEKRGGGFLDCYKNLTIKTMAMLEWLDAHFSSASYAMKIDSDMFLNVPKLIGMFSNYKQTNYMSGLVEKGAAVLRDPKSKWYVPVEIYPYPYPRYALGLGYVLSLDLPKKLVEASRHVKALYIEDVYLGLCMLHLGISPTDPPNRSYFNVFPVAYSRCAYSRLVATTTHEYADRVRVWKDFNRPDLHCVGDSFTPNPFCVVSKTQVRPKQPNETI